jgi:hypothetical protein
MREVAGTQSSAVVATQVPGLGLVQVPGLVQVKVGLHRAPLLLHLPGQSSSVTQTLWVLLHLFVMQSALVTHHSPLSAHILAGWPSAQKSPRGEVQGALSVQELQFVFFVSTPCLQEPHGLPGDVMQCSAFAPRPELSAVLEMKRQKSPLVAVLTHASVPAQHAPSDEHRASDSLQ